MRLWSRVAQILCPGRFWRGTPQPTPGSFRPGCEREQASRPGAAPVRGGRRADRDRGGARLAGLEEAALGGRWPCGSSGSRGASSLPDVSPARGARLRRESKREEPRNFRGAPQQRTCLLGRGGGPAAIPRSGSRSGEAGDPRPGTHEAAGASRYAVRAAAAVREEAVCVATARSRLAELSAGNPAAHRWASRARNVGAGKFLGLQPLRSGGYEAGGGRGRSLPASPGLPSRAGCAARRVTLRGLVSEPSGPRPGGAGGFFEKLSPSQERAAGLMPRAARRGDARHPELQDGRELRAGSLRAR